MLMMYLFLAFTALAFIFALFSAKQSYRRQEEMRALGDYLGLEFRAGGPYDAPGRPSAPPSFWETMFGGVRMPAPTAFIGRFAGFEPFGRGMRPRVQNLLCGTRDGADWYLFDYTFQTDEGRDSQTGRQERRTHHYGVVVARVPLMFAGMSLRPENALHRIGRHLGMQDLDFEWEEFNRRYVVQSKVPKQAHDLLHPTAMEFLMQREPRHWQLQGFYILICRPKRFSAEESEAVFEDIRGFLETIPEYFKQDCGFVPRWTSAADFD